MIVSHFKRSLTIAIALIAIMHAWSAMAEEQWALLIGNQDYEALPPLRNPISDVRRFADRLSALDFNVVAYENLSNSTAMRASISQFANDARAAGAETILVHYAGHGFEINGSNYLVPTSITQASEQAIAEQLALETDGQAIDDDTRLARLGQMRLTHIQNQSLDLNQVLGMVEQAAPTRILLFDACRDLPDMRSTESLGSEQLTGAGFAAAEGSAGTLITFSAQPGHVASDGLGPISPFMQAVLDHIDVRGIDINELMTRVRRDVHARTAGDQVPWTHSALLEPFSFRPVPEGYYGDDRLAENQAEQNTQQTVSPGDTDEQLWRKVAGSFEIEAYQSYLQAFPNGAHADEARQLLSKLGSLYGNDMDGQDTAAAVETSPVDADAPRQFDQNTRGPKRVVVVGDSDLVADRLPNAGDPAIGLPDALVDRIAVNLAKSPRFEIAKRHALRRVISEQRYDRTLGESYLEKTFEQSFGDVRSTSGDVVIIPDNILVDGNGLDAGSDLGISEATADHQDLLKDLQTLGSSVSAEYLIFGRLESIDHDVQKRRLPNTEPTQTGKPLNALLRLRVVDVEQAKIIAAISLETEIEAEVFRGSASDVRSAMFDLLSRDVTGVLADVLHPATVIKTDPLVIDRGVIHGLNPGDTFTIVRPSEDVLVSQGGIELGRPIKPVARVRVIASEDLWSEVELTDGHLPAQYDMARLDRDAEPTPISYTDFGDVSSGGEVSALEGGTKPEKRDQWILALPRIETAQDGHFDLDLVDLKPRLKQELATRLRATNRFVVAEHSAFDEFFSIDGVIEGNTEMPEAFEAVDHLVLTRLDNLLVEKTSEYINTLGEELVRNKAVVELQIRMVNARSFQQVIAETVRFERELPDDFDRRDPRLVLGDVLTTAADAAVQQIMSATFPVEIIGGGPEQWYVNRGADGGLSVGDSFLIYHQGKEMTDASGLAFGRTEKEVGHARVIQVDAARSLVELQAMSGNVAVGDILRPFEDRPLPAGSAPSPPPQVNTPKW